MKRIVGYLNDRPAEVESTGRRRVKVGWAGFTVFRYLDGEKEAVVLSAGQANKKFKAHIKPGY